MRRRADTDRKSAARMKASAAAKPKPASLPNRRAGWRIASLRYCLARSMNSPTSSGSWRIEAMLGPSRRLVHRRAVRCSQESRLTVEYLHLEPEAGRCVACFQMCWISGHEILGWRLPHARRPSDPRRSRRRRPGPPLPLSSPHGGPQPEYFEYRGRPPATALWGVSPRCPPRLGSRLSEMGRDPAVSSPLMTAPPIDPRRNLSPLVGGHSLSLLGDYLAFFFALPVFVRDITGSAAQLGLLAVSETLAVLLFGFVARVLIYPLRIRSAL